MCACPTRSQPKLLLITINVLRQKFEKTLMKLTMQWKIKRKKIFSQRQVGYTDVAIVRSSFDTKSYSQTARNQIRQKERNSTSGKFFVLAMNALTMSTLQALTEGSRSCKDKLKN